jgi:hypothetical protein
VIYWRLTFGWRSIIWNKRIRLGTSRDLRETAFCRNENGGEPAGSWPEFHPLSNKLGIMKKIELPRTSERIRGFTLPADGAFYIVDYDEVFRIRLDGTPSVDILDVNPYEFEGKTDTLLGVSDRAPLARVGETEISYSFNPKDRYQTVTLRANGRADTISFCTMSGDWFVASLSEDGKYMVVAEPYLLELYALV